MEAVNGTLMRDYDYDSGLGGREGGIAAGIVCTSSTNTFSFVNPTLIKR